MKVLHLIWNSCFCQWHVQPLIGFCCQDTQIESCWSWLEVLSPQLSKQVGGKITKFAVEFQQFDADTVDTELKVTSDYLYMEVNECE